jgi:hypothetical protein
LEPIENLTPEKVFDARWAMALLAEAMDRLNREYIDQGKTDAFEVLKAFLDPLNSKKPPPYEQMAEQLEVSAVKTLIHFRCSGDSGFIGSRVEETEARINSQVSEFPKVFVKSA